MNWNSFKSKFHKSWHKDIKPFIESKKCDEIYKFLKEETKAGVRIAPASSNTFRTFFITPLDEVKCVIIGGAPYDRYYKDQPIATGVLLDCSITKQVTPQLKNFYEGIEKEFYDGINLNYVQDWNLDYLAERGVLLLNSSLTVEKDKINNHFEIWKPFISFILKEIISWMDVPVILIGEEAQFYRKLINATNYIYPLSTLKGIGQKWDTKNTFNYVNKRLSNNDLGSIMWLNIDVPF